MNNKGADQTARMCRLICTFVVRIMAKSGFLMTWLIRRTPKCENFYKCNKAPYMFKHFTTDVIRPLKCNNVFTTNVKTIIVRRNATIEIFLTHQKYFTYFEQSRTLGGTKSGYHSFDFLERNPTIFIFSVTAVNNCFHICGKKVKHLRGLVSFVEIFTFRGCSNAFRHIHDTCF